MGGGLVRREGGVVTKVRDVRGMLVWETWAEETADESDPRYTYSYTAAMLEHERQLIERYH